jgi:cytochrome c oxidase assembly protein subunit 15
MAKVQGRYKVQSKPFISRSYCNGFSAKHFANNFWYRSTRKIDAVASHLEGSYRDSWTTRAGEIFVTAPGYGHDSTGN